MTNAKATNFSEERLTFLWNSRQNLGKNEWTELFNIVYKTLKSYENKSRLNFLGLGEDSIEDHIHDFFIRKVMRNFNDEEREVNRGHLTGFFRTFLIDQRRTEKKYDNTFSLDAEDDEDKKPQEYADLKIFEFTEDELKETMLQYGFSVESLIEKTKQFFDGLEIWQQAVLTDHFCPETVNSIALSHLQERYPQSATYYKVTQLGIVHKSSKLPNTYKTTVIGKWMHFTLGIKIEEENMNMILVVFRILCAMALSQNYS